VRMDWLRMAQARGRYLGMELELITPREAADVFPLMDPQYFVGALYDPVEGHVDPTGVTRAYAKCAQLAGAEIRQHTKVDGLSQRADGTWDESHFTGTGFPGHFYLKYHLYQQHFPLTALGRYSRALHARS
ncbi:MAG TPA: FAD-dependent oxidoreductase, partial [Candidatus Acidoferrales bacterium]|nr:FAD-dependent oxidoreductase [Candidatus Acidoferrales bacterium]